MGAGGVEVASLMGAGGTGCGLVEEGGVVGSLENIWMICRSWKNAPQPENMEDVSCRLLENM